VNQKTISDTDKIFTRISKAQARSYFNADIDIKIVLCPSRLRPGTPWNPEIYLPDATLDSFEMLVRRFEHYNCNVESGYYASYYTVKNI